MSTDTRHKNSNWRCNSPGEAPSFNGAQLAVLMDIRDEIQRLNSLLHCNNFTQIPHILRSIRRNTAKPRKKRGKA
jgi:hypothetical protein